jgi:probable rRNA maturation factor
MATATDTGTASLRRRPASSPVDVLVTVSGAPPSSRIEAWTRSLLLEARAKRVFLSILLCGDARMRSLNREWLGMDIPTDVLSFPSGERDFLGDIVIDVPYAARQARRRGHTLQREVQILLAHGLLHLLGYDHEKDDGTMLRLQRRLVLAAFGEGPDGVP